VCLAELFVPALADDPAVADDDGADQRIGLDPTAAALGEFESPTHLVDVSHLRGQGSGSGVKEISISGEPTRELCVILANGPRDGSKTEEITTYTRI